MSRMPRSIGRPVEKSRLHAPNEPQMPLKPRSSETHLGSRLGSRARFTASVPLWTFFEIHVCGRRGPSDDLIVGTGGHARFTSHGIAGIGRFAPLR